MLTRKQRELLDFIIAYQKREDGISPTLQEMVTGVGLKTRSGVHRLLVQLEERGFIRRLKNRTRAIEVLVKNGVMVPPARQHLVPPVELKRDYLCQAGQFCHPETVALPLLNSDDLTGLLFRMADGGKPYKLSVIIRLQQLEATPSTVIPAKAGSQLQGGQG